MVNQNSSKILTTLSDQAINRLKQNSWDPKALRTNKTLPEDAWEEVDDTVYTVARQRLQALTAMRDAGVMSDLGGLHVLYDRWETVSDMGEAKQSMDFDSQADNEAPDYVTHMVPIPITHADFRIGFRKMSAMEQASNTTVDDAMVAQATRKVSEKIEYTLFFGTDVTLNGNPAYGLTTHPDATDVTGDADWTGSWGTNPGSIYEDVQYLANQVKSNNYYGPYILFLSNDAFEDANITDPEGNGNLLLLDRLENIPRIDAVVEVDQLDDNYAVMVDPSSDVIQVPTAADIQAVEWESKGGYQTNFKIFGAMAPRVMSDDNSNTGIAYATDA